MLKKYFLLILFMISTSVFAADNHYQAAVPVNDMSDGARQTAMQQALAEVIAAQTGQDLPAALKRVQGSVKDVSSYVFQYSYARNTIDPNKGRMLMTVDFAPHAVNAFLHKNQTNISTKVTKAINTELIITGVSHYQDYEAVKHSLAQVGLIEHLEISNIASDQVIFNAAVQGGKDALASVLNQDKHFSLQADATSTSNHLAYRWVG